MSRLQLPRHCAESNIRHPRFVALLALAGFIVCDLDTAEARRPIHRHHRIERDGGERSEIKKTPTGPLFAVVSIADQQVSFYDANGLFVQSRVSTGVSEHPTPTGIFTIMEKERWHRSNIYSGAPMPFMQRLTWTGVAMHEGVVPPHPASHGCIRLPGDFAKRLFSLTKEGQRVIVSSEDVVPAEIVHAHLPAPKLLPPPADAEAQKNAIKKDGNAVEPVTLERPAEKLLNPVEFAQAVKAAAIAKASAGAQAKKAAAALMESKSVEARAAARELAVAEDALRRAQDDVEDAGRSVARAKGDEALQKANEKKAAADAKLASANDKVRASRDAKAAKDEEVLSLQAAIRDAGAAEEAAAAAVKEAAIRSEPLSIFISRKTGRLYVRQATQHLFDAPVTIRNPERPLGTHLFIATKAGEDGASLRWASLTPPAAVEVKVRPRSSRRGRHIQPEEESPSFSPFPESASAALDRIEIPQEAAERISELLWTGATLIVSDVGMSGEGRFAMDFMILTRTLVREP